MTLDPCRCGGEAVSFSALFETHFVICSQEDCTWDAISAGDSAEAAAQEWNDATKERA